MLNPNNNQGMVYFLMIIAPHITATADEIFFFLRESSFLCLKLGKKIWLTINPAIQVTNNKRPRGVMHMRNIFCPIQSWYITIVAKKHAAIGVGNPTKNIVS